MTQFSRGSQVGIVLVLMGLFGSPSVRAQALKLELEDNRVGDRWTYNDWAEAKAAATRLNKPIFALFR